MTHSSCRPANVQAGKQASCRFVVLFRVHGCARATECVIEALSRDDVNTARQESNVGGACRCISRRIGGLAMVNE